MLPPLPRCSRWAYSSLKNHPIRISLPRFHYRVGLHIDLFEVCSAFTRVAACTLARSPNSDRYPGASDISSPPCLPRLLPAGAIAGWASHPLENAALSRRTWKAVIRTRFLHDLSDCFGYAGLVCVILLHRAHCVSGVIGRPKRSAVRGAVSPITPVRRTRSAIREIHNLL